MFSLRLKALRESNEISQQVLADFLHYSQQSVAKWESGESMPPVDVLTRIGEYFKVSADYLLGQDLVIKETGGEYASAKDLVMRLILQPAVARQALYALDTLSENDLSVFADDVLQMVAIAARRFEPK